MIIFLIILFLFLILYTYLGYLLLVFILGSCRRLKIDKSDIFPTVSLMIAAFNEEKSIREKIENSLAINYPKEKLDIIIVSDGSTDNTDRIVQEYSDKGVRLIRIEGRVGKTEARNQAMKMIDTVITLFSDATTTYQSDTISKLVRSFNDPTIGMATGHLIYRDSENTQMGVGQKLYWKYETLIKKAQTNLGTLTGSIGCITAFRTKAYEALPANIIEDFTSPLMFIQKGFRVVFEPEAICFEETTKKTSNEWSMRVRVIRGGITGLLFAKKVLNPLKYPVASFQLISHKVSRWLVPFYGLAIALLSIIGCFTQFENLFDTLFIRTISVLQILFYLVVLTSYLLEKKSIHNKFLGIPLYFFIINLASLVALIKTFNSKLEATWETDR